MEQILEIIERQNDVTYEIPKVSFPAYEEYKDKAEAIADYIGSMTVDEDNIKETKQTLAKARKLTDRLTRARIDMKRAILENYTTFESQVKEIVSIVDDADRGLRSKVRDLEEAEREKKLQEIHHIWIKRVSLYPMIEKVMPDAFDRWISPKHLNKSTSMKSVEADMTEWIQKTVKDMDTALSMGEEYLAAYGWKGDLTEAINAVNERKEMLKNVEELEDATNEEQIPTATFIICGTKDIALAESLFKEYEITYTRKDY